jgi:hypothetical protein
VARLVSHARLLETLDTAGIWSVARGLARSVAAYKEHLANCDLPRRNDLDGRGNLSEEALAAFSRFFLETCLDQVSFMESLVQPDRLRARILLWAEDEIRFGNLPPKSGNVLEAVLYRGELPRGDAAGIAGTGDRQARRLVSSLLEKQVLTSESSRSPLRLAFPASLAPRWMPGLFPEKTRTIDDQALSCARPTLHIRCRIYDCKQNPLGCSNSIYFPTCGRSPYTRVRRPNHGGNPGAFERCNEAILRCPQPIDVLHRFRRTPSQTFGNDRR